jgi:hypothetical protein
VVWVEGEPGIGKSSLVAESLAVVDGAEVDVGWGMADSLTERLPLRVMQDCLRVRPNSPDRRRARGSDVLRSLPSGVLADGDRSMAGVEVLAALVDELGAAAPMVMCNRRSSVGRRSVVGPLAPALGLNRPVKRRTTINQPRIPGAVGGHL